MNDQKLKWGILGTGGIAHKLAGAINESKLGSLCAVGSRSQETAERFANEFGIPKRYSTYQEVLDDSEVQAIYISLPNHLHAEWTIRSAKARKAILCEKPFTVNRAEAEKALLAVKEADVFFMEAFQYRCHPIMGRINDLLHNKAIGNLKVIHASFQYNLGPRYENIRLSNPAAGGGIMDVGCYTAAFARMAAGAALGQPFAEPIRVKGCAYLGAISRVDEQAVASLEFPEGIMASLACGTQLEGDTTVQLFGSEGSLAIPFLWVPPAHGSKIILRRSGKDAEEILMETNANPYSIEADMVAESCAKGLKEAIAPAMSYADTLGNMLLLDRWRQEAGLIFDVER